MISICRGVNDFYDYCNPGYDGSLYDLLMDSMGQVQSTYRKTVSIFVEDGNTHDMEWFESFSPTDGHGREAHGLLQPVWVRAAGL